jgi:transcriptional regulator with XRE-family HTH domain
MAGRRVDPIDVVVGQRIRAYRLARKMSQTELGNKVGVTFQQIQKYERGSNRLGSSRLKKVAVILGVPVASLFGDAEETRTSTVDKVWTKALSRRYATRLLLAFDVIENTKQRLAIVQLIESIGKKAKRQ